MVLPSSLPTLPLPLFLPQELKVCPPDAAVLRRRRLHQRHRQRRYRQAVVGEQAQHALVQHVEQLGAAGDQVRLHRRIDFAGQLIERLARFRRTQQQQRIIQRQRRAALHQRRERTGGIPLVAALGHRLEKCPACRCPGSLRPDFHRLGSRPPDFSPPGFSPTRILAPWILTAWVFPARILAPWILTAWVFAAWVFTARVFLRDGQIHGVGAVVQRHIEEGRLGDRRRELAVNAAVRGQNAVALAGFIAGLRIQRRDLHLGLIANGGFARHQQLVAAAVTGDIDVIEGFADKIQVAFQRQRADITIAGRDMAAGLDLGLAQRAVATQRAAGA